MNQLQAEMKRIRDLLPTELFEDSKDWREGNTVERIEWLLSMYESSKQEVDRLQDELEAAVQYNFDRS
jgi:ATP-dependent protease HslVU (ClpYQ) peptidase subunit